MTKLTDEEAFARALIVASVAHGTQRDLDGRLFLTHVLSVCQGVSSLQDKTVAVLHEIVASTPVTIQQLEETGIPANIIKYVDALTKRPHEDYVEEYIPRVASAGATAIRVKLADIKDNMALGEAKISEQRMMRYIKAKSMLSTALSNYPMDLSIKI